MISALLIVIALAIVVAAGWMHLDSRRQAELDRGVLTYGLDGPHRKPPRAIARLCRRNRADLNRALNR